MEGRECAISNIGEDAPDCIRHSAHIGGTGVAHPKRGSSSLSIEGDGWNRRRAVSFPEGFSIERPLAISSTSLSNWRTSFISGSSIS